MKKFSKFIIDTNIIFSALYDPNSNAGRLIELALERKIELYAPEKVKEELSKNLKDKLGMEKQEIQTIMIALPIKWLNKNLYKNFIAKASKIISKKDTPILASHFLTKYPIITEDKEFFNLKNVEVYKLQEIIENRC